MGTAPILPCCLLFRPREPDASLQVVVPKLTTKPTRAALDIYVSRLRLAGQRGELLLVNLDTLAVLIRRNVA